MECSSQNPLLSCQQMGHEPNKKHVKYFFSQDGFGDFWYFLSRLCMFFLKLFFWSNWISNLPLSLLIDDWQLSLPCDWVSGFIGGNLNAMAPLPDHCCADSFLGYFGFMFVQWEQVETQWPFLVRSIIAIRYNSCDWSRGGCDVIRLLLNEGLVHFHLEEIIQNVKWCSSCVCSWICFFTWLANIW